VAGLVNPKDVLSLSLIIFVQTNLLFLKQMTLKMLLMAVDNFSTGQIRKAFISIAAIKMLKPKSCSGTGWPWMVVPCSMENHMLRMLVYIITMTVRKLLILEKVLVLVHYLCLRLRPPPLLMMLQVVEYTSKGIFFQHYFYEWFFCLINLSLICQINFVSHVIIRRRRVSRAVKDHSISVTRILNDEKLWNILIRLVVQGETHFWNMLLRMKFQTREKKWIHCSVRKPNFIAKNQTKHQSAALWQLEFHGEWSFWCFVYVLEFLWCKA